MHPVISNTKHADTRQTPTFPLRLHFLCFLIHYETTKFISIYYVNKNLYIFWMA